MRREQAADQKQSAQRLDSHDRLLRDALAAGLTNIQYGARFLSVAARDNPRLGPRDRTARYLVLQQLRVMCPGSQPSTPDAGDRGFNVVFVCQQVLFRTCDCAACRNCGCFDE